MGPPQTRAMAAKILALVAALAVSAYASPLIDRSGDVTDFDKVSSMIVNAQNNDMIKATEEAADIPAWETPAWMGRRTNASLSVGASVSMNVASVTGFTATEGNTAGTGTYVFLANTYLGALELPSISSSASTTVAQQIDGVTSYSAAVASAASAALASSSSLSGSVAVTGVTSTAATPVVTNSATRVTVGIFALFAALLSQLF